MSVDLLWIATLVWCKVEEYYWETCPLYFPNSIKLSHDREISPIFSIILLFCHRPSHHLQCHHLLVFLNTESSPVLFVFTSPRNYLMSYGWLKINFHHQHHQHHHQHHHHHHHLHQTYQSEYVFVTVFWEWTHFHRFWRWVTYSITLRCYWWSRVRV